ncbi:MAG: NAD kinase [Pseudomonadota bacterium]
MAKPALCILANGKDNAEKTASKLRELHGDHSIENADIIVPVGGDGFILETMRRYYRTEKPFYGVNCGTVGFLMNSADPETLGERIENAESVRIHPLIMRAQTSDGREVTARAINEVSLFRQTRQSAKIKISVNGKVRMESLTCDGILLATPAGSTAYNLSAHGPILPIGADLLALTPISAFRPRRWKGALLPAEAEVTFTVLERGARPISAVADNEEVRDVVAVTAKSDPSVGMTLLFDQGQSLDERILREQFEN